MAVTRVRPLRILVVAEDGYVISSAINFIQQPSSILVMLPSGKRATAKIVARDQARMLVLLKVATEEKLPVPTAAPRNEMAVGQSAIAMGRTFDKSGPSLSVDLMLIEPSKRPLEAATAAFLAVLEEETGRVNASWGELT